MNTINEIWHDAFYDSIPKDPHYTMLLEQGEECGLVIHLESQNNLVTLNFGNIQAVNILDEGTLLNSLPGAAIQNHAQLRQTGFSSVLYRIENGTYEAYVKACMTKELYEAYDLRQYNVVTMNYVVEIIAHGEPKITVHK